MSSILLECIAGVSKALVLPLCSHLFLYCIGEQGVQLAASANRSSTGSSSTKEIRSAKATLRRGEIIQSSERVTKSSRETGLNSG